MIVRKTTVTTVATIIALGCGDGATDDDTRTIPEAFTDSLDVVFLYDESVGITAEAEDDIIAKCYGDDPVLFDLDFGATGVAMICAVDRDTGGRVSETCRPMRCQHDQDCRYEMGYLRTDCIKGICQCVDGACPCVDGACPPSRPEGTVGETELIALCLHDQQRPMACPRMTDASVDHSTIFSALDSCNAEYMCELPATCLQP